MERKAYPRFVYGFEHLFHHYIYTKCKKSECQICQQCLDIISYGVSLVVRVLLLEMYRSSEGSNLTVFLRPLLSKKQCYDVITNKRIDQTQDDVCMKQWRYFNKTYFPTLNLSILFPKDALYFLTFLSYSDTFHVLVDLYNELFTTHQLSFRAKTFVMLMWHLNGLIALNPGFVETMWGDALESNLIVWEEKQL